MRDFLKAGIEIYSTQNVASIYWGVIPVHAEKTYSLGDFKITPLVVEHDEPCLAYLVYHPEMGSLYFFTDAYNMKQAIRGCRTYMCEVNYEDGLLEKAVNEGRTIVSLADRIRLSHMSLAHGIEFMRDCEAEKSARQIILIHGSTRHLHPEAAVSKFQQVVGVPTFYAKTGLQIDLM